MLKSSTHVANVGTMLVCLPREGVINKWPLNDLFHDVVTVIITFQTDIFEVDNDNDDDEMTLVVILRIIKTL